MLLGLALIAVPLLVAILTAALQIRTLADTGQKIVLQGVAAARASQDLFSEIASLERTARLYDVLNDPNLLETYRRWDTRLTATRDQLNAYGAGETRKTLAQLGELQGTIRTTILTMPAGTGAANMAALSGRFIELSTLVDRVAQQSNAQIDKYGHAKYLRYHGADPTDDHWKELVAQAATQTAPPAGFTSQPRPWPGDPAPGRKLTKV